MTDAISSAKAESRHRRIRAPLTTFSVAGPAVALDGPDGPNLSPRAVRPTLPLAKVVISLADDPEIVALRARMARANARIDLALRWLVRAEIAIAILAAAIAVRPICAALSAAIS